ncbi:kinase [Streptomyces venezuelae]|uniref:Kinase n=1 Tax=Streptomyces venezuelae TaxID=54571 RepID=A0A5P2DRP8_STRVZ|nr:zeta toxin family protein [Streptomyces venezuelae]QES57210.1 kinase [Streptomyces venezuelae]
MTSAARLPRLIVLRGNSGSGKTAVATELRHRLGRRLAVVGQDNVRRVILKERDTPGAANIGLIDTITRYSLIHGFHTLVEGILSATRYGEMLQQLHRDHGGHFFYLDVPFEETLARHATRPQAADFGADEMADWYRAQDLLPGVPEHVIGLKSSLSETADLIMSIAEVG